MIRAAALAIALTAATVGAETLTLTPQQMRVVASESVLKGLPDQAVDLAEALLGRDPSDIDALLILSRATRDLGDLNRAREAAAKAWRLAETDDHKFSAALARAQALSSQGSRTRAQLWLRAAAQVAPDDRAKAVAVRDFQYVRSRNPWATQLSFNIAPSDNINNGSSEDTSELFGLPLQFELSGASRALSGTEISAGIATSYRLLETRKMRLRATFDLDHRTYVLSDEAEEIAPDAKGSDFAVTNVAAGLAADGRFGETKLGYSAYVELGRSWYAGDPYLDTVRAGGSLSYLLSPRAKVQLSLGHEWQTGLNGREDADILRARVGLAHLLDGGSALSWSLGWEQSTSEADYLDYTRRDAGVRLTLGKPVWNTTLSFGVSASEKFHDTSSLTGGERRETTLGADMTVTLNQLEVMGFVPSIRIHTSRTDGNIDLLDKDTTGIGFSIKSAF